VTEEALEHDERLKLVALRVCSETGTKPYALVTLNVNGEQRAAGAEGGGPVDAAFKAIDSVLESQCNLLLYSVNNITTVPTRRAR